MQKLAQCDDVFERLTRGPFSPDTAEDQAIEDHLRACHECRRLAEALRPAVGLFHECVDANQQGSLPGYRGALPEHSAPVAEVMAKIVEHDLPAASRKRESKQHATYRVIGALAAGLLIGLLLAAPARVANHVGGGSVATAEAPIVGVPDAGGLVLLAGLNLDVRCWPLADDEPLPSTLTELRFACCTRCHHAAQTATSAQNSPDRLWRSCGACHNHLAMLDQPHAPKRL